MRIGILLSKSDYTYESTNLVAMIQLLADRGITLDLIYPEQQLIELEKVQVKNDLYLIKACTDLSMSLAGVLHALGAVTINPYPVVVMLRNKIIGTRILQQAGAPVPETYMTYDADELVPLLSAGPLIVKPYKGSKGEGLRVLTNVDEVEALPRNELIFAQRYYHSNGCDHKVYCIGDQLFGVKRIAPIKVYADKIGEPFVLSPELRDIAQRIRQAFGIDLFGFDVVMHDGCPYVVDVNKFSGYMGVPDAPRLLADHICAVARHRVRTDLPLWLPQERTRPWGDIVSRS